MRKLKSAAVLALAFTLAFVATPRASEELQAQVGVPCTCNWLQGTPVQSLSCLGTADMSSVTCAQFLNLCVITGFATWQPAAPNCIISGNNNGWIVPVASGSGATSFFDPGAAQPGVPWGAFSANCAGIAFGAVMQVTHNQWTGSCVCTGNTSTVTTVASGLWTCDSQ